MEKENAFVKDPKMMAQVDAYDNVSYKVEEIGNIIVYEDSDSKEYYIDSPAAVALKFTNEDYRKSAFYKLSNEEFNRIKNDKSLNIVLKKYEAPSIEKIIELLDTCVRALENKTSITKEENDKTLDTLDNLMRKYPNDEKIKGLAIRIMSVLGKISVVDKPKKL